MTQRVVLTYRGQVQGVGFRATACRLARARGLNGFVRNQADGRVYLEAEGEPAALEGLLSDIAASRLGPLIEDRQVAWGPALGGPEGFEIQYW